MRGSLGRWVHWLSAPFQVVDSRDFIGLPLPIGGVGRGGDQAVVKNGEKLSFFGGKTKEFEKRTKVRARVIAHALKDLINESSKIFIMGHKNPDIDCLGSAVGLSIIRR